jgi:hypothetical protein
MSKNIKSFSLALEELSLGLGLINRQDLGRQLISNIYENLKEELIDARLSSASHSLLARGLCTISESGQPILLQELQQVIFPLAKFDFAIQISIVQDGNTIPMTIHVQRGKCFTVHAVQLGVVHVLEYGEYGQLVPYIADMMNNFGDKETNKIGRITPDLLGQLLNSPGRELTSRFTAYGWKSLHVEQLLDDLKRAVFRATLIFVNASDKTEVEAIRQSEHKTILLLKGKTRSWIFDFPGSGDQVEGNALLVTGEDFRNMLTRFLGK